MKTAPPEGEIVVDGSTALAFLLRDEQAPQALKVLRMIEEGAVAHVPTHWWLETGNGLLMAERRKRISQAESTEALHLLQALPVRTDTETAPRVAGETAALARQHLLTVYAAAYLELAMRRRAALATTDQALGKAARAVGVAVISR